MNDWDTYSFAALTENLDSRRKPVKEADRRRGPFPYYGASGVVDYVDDYLFDGLYLLVAEDGENLRTRKLPIAFLADGKFWVNNHAHIVRGNDKADTRFLHYALQVADVTSYLSGSTMPKLTQANLNRILIRAPDIGTQRAIADVLSAFDDKIELNRRTNETLEQMAQAIFKDWFVDFGPVRRKQEGVLNPIAIMGGLVQEPARAAELAALFPGSFGDNDLPKGWTYTSVYTHAKIHYGAPFASSRFNSAGIGRPLIRIRDLPNHRTDIYTDEIHSKEFLVCPGDIVVGMDGEFRARLWLGLESLMNQRVCCFAPHQRDRRAFVLFSIRPWLERYEKSAIGTTVIHLGKKDIDTFSLVMPSEPTITAFASIAEPLLARLISAGAESRTLAETRDYLLPKLMSGEVRVREAAACLQGSEDG